MSQEKLQEMTSADGVAAASNHHHSHVHTPLPKDQMLCVLFIQLCEALNVNVLFPFMAFMVEDFGYAGSSLGYYVGCLAAAFCTAQFFSSVLWGRISDIYGRKPAIIVGTAGTVAGMLLFGLAKTYAQAVLGRLLAGLLSGNIGVLKTYVTEITDDSNRATGFSYLSLAWAAGCIVAPLFGGLLSNPAAKYPKYFDEKGLFGIFPYFLPILLCVILLVVSIVVCLLFMKETNALLLQSTKESKLQQSEVEMTVNPVTKNTASSNMKKDYSPLKKSDENEQKQSDGAYAVIDLEAEDRTGERRVTLPQDITSSDFDEEEEDEICFLCASRSSASIALKEDPIDRSSHALISEDVISSSGGSSSSSAAKSQPSRPKRSPLTHRVVVLSCCNYMVLCMAFILFDETLPLYLKLDISQGGFSFDSLNIGSLLSAAGVFLLIFAAFILPRVGKHFKKAVFHYSLIVVTCHVLLWPMCGSLNEYLLKYYSPTTVECIVYPLLLILLSLKTAMASCCFMASTIQVNHSVYSEDLGIVNGFGQALGAMARGVGPALGGVLWSASTSMGFVYLNFIAVAVLWGINMWINSMLPLSLDVKKTKRSSRTLLTANSKASNNPESDSDEEELAIEF